jgi:signal transduction histidine kinase
MLCGRSSLRVRAGELPAIARVTALEPRPRPASAHAARVAAIAALLTAVLYIGVVVLFDVLDARHLVAQVDAHVVDRLNKITRNGGLAVATYRIPPGENDVDTAPVVIWRADRRGDAVPITPGASPLPFDSWPRSGRPASAITGSGEFRLIAALTPGGWLVAGESLAETQHVEAVVGRAETIAGPVLVFTMFFGALATGLLASRPLEQARRRELEFTADASHELRTPVAVIEAEVALALSSPRDGNSYRGTLRRIGTEGRRLRRVVEDLLFLARSDAKLPMPRDEPVDLVTLAGASVRRIAPTIESKDIQLSVLPTGAGPVLVQAPPGWVDRLCSVLIDNACRYAGDGGTVSVVVGASGKIVSLSVEDSGPGIPPQQGLFLFDRFRRGSDDGEGAGLELAIADAVVRSTGGKWRVTSAPGGGAHMEVLWRRLYARENSRTWRLRRQTKRAQ